MKGIHCLICLILILQFSGICRAQNQTVKPLDAYRYTIEQGLSQNRITETFTDRKGFLWIGTTDGLNRFDGYQFKKFNHLPLDTVSISSNYIRCIEEDFEGNLWIGTHEGLNLYNSLENKFERITLSEKPTNEKMQDIRALFSRDDDELWVLTNANLITLNISTREYASVKLPFHLKALSIHTELIKDRRGIVWFGTGKGLMAYDQIQRRFRHYRMDGSDEYSLGDNDVRTVFEDSNGELWVGTAKGLNRYDRLKDRFMPVAGFSQSVKELEINTISEDLNNRIWFGGKTGLGYFSKRSSQLSLLSRFSIENDGGKIFDVTSVVCDSSNILWAGSVNGLYKIDLKPKKFELYDNSDHSIKRLTHRNVTAIQKDDFVRLWVGYKSNGFDKIDLNSGKTESFTIKNGLKANQVRSFYRDSKKRLWIGTSRGVNILYPESDVIYQFEDLFKTIPVDILLNKEILVVEESPEGIFWIGTDNGMFVFREHLRIVNSYQDIYNQKENVKLGKVYDIISDEFHNIWLATENGLIHYNVKNDVFERIQPASMNNRLTKSPVYSLLRGNDHNIWVGTSYGLGCFDTKRQKLNHYSGENELLNSQVYAILEDIESNIWISSNRGIAKFNPKKLEFTHYSLREGLQAYEYNRGAGFVSSDGELFFGGVSGLNSFYPDEINKSIIKPGMAITDIEVIENGLRRNVPVSEDRSSMEVKYDESFIIRFAALDFTAPSKNKYMYSLQETGKPEKWISLGDQHSLTISNLSSGEYVFKVKGSNNDGVWSSGDVNLKILVEAPFWKTRIAIISIVIILTLLFYLIIQYRTQSLRKSNRILKEREQTGKEIARQKELLSRRNKNIEDSLKYANKIQSAMLTTPKQFKEILPHSFILHQPKDIVSGDFYWISEVDDRIFVAAIDCTGHGVPGAFMSIIGFELFRKIINMQKITDPGQILNTLNQNFQEIFSSGNDIALRDGMDLSFCVLDKKDMVLNYAGAFNPLYLIRNNKLIEIKGDRFSVGADNESIEGYMTKEFTSHKLKLEKDDVIYLFSDGYADQFGGPEGKKYKYRRFRHLLLTIHHLPLERQKTYLWESIEEWRGNIEQIDDILVIGIRPKF